MSFDLRTADLRKLNSLTDLRCPDCQVLPGVWDVTAQRFVARESADA